MQRGQTHQQIPANRVILVRTSLNIASPSLLRLLAYHEIRIDKDLESSACSTSAVFHTSLLPPTWFHTWWLTDVPPMTAHALSKKVLQAVLSAPR